MDSDTDDEQEEQAAQLSREQLLSLNPFALPRFSKRRLRYMAAFDVENWHEQLDSFATAVDAVSYSEGLALQHHYQQGCCGQLNKVTHEDAAALVHLRTKVERLLASLSGGSFFVRLGPRSPKDAPSMVSEPWGVSEERIRTTLGNTVTEPLSEPHHALHCFQTACTHLLRVVNPDEAIALLVSSARVMGDVSHTLDGGEDDWEMSIVARSWDSRVLLEREFRVFVVAGHVTAISQYDDRLCYDFVAAQTGEIAKAILRSVELLRPGLMQLGLAEGNSALVADFVVVPCEKSGLEAKLIEINPFGTMTGAALFSWEAERRLLQGGRDL